VEGREGRKESRGGDGRERRVPKVTPLEKILDPQLGEAGQRDLGNATKLCLEPRDHHRICAHSYLSQYLNSGLSFHFSLSVLYHEILFTERNLSFLPFFHIYSIISLSNASLISALQSGSSVT